MKNEMRPKPRDGRVMMVNTDSCSVLEPTLCRAFLSESWLPKSIHVQPPDPTYLGTYLHVSPRLRAPSYIYVIVQAEGLPASPAALPAPVLRPLDLLMSA